MATAPAKTSIISAAPRMQKMRGERNLFSSSDDNVIMKQIIATHSPDGRLFDVKPVLVIIEDVLRRATPILPAALPHPVSEITQAHVGAIEEEKALSEMLEIMAYTINKLSWELSYKCSGGGGDAHATTMSLFNSLSNYPWEGKVVIGLAAFAVIYGEFWLVAQLYLANPLAKSVAQLLQLPDLLESGDSLKPQFEALSNLIKAMLNLTKCIVEFKDLPSQYISSDTPDMITATAHIPTAVYWILRSIVACTCIIVNLIGMGHEYITSTTEAWELSSLAHKISSIHGHLSQQLALCYQYISERRHDETYLALIRLFETAHIDNTKILRALIYSKDDQLPLFESSTKRRVGIDTLRRKIVLLLISDLELSQDELSLLDQMYREARQNPTRPESQYEVVWIPIINTSLPWTEANQKQFETIQNTMPWLSVYHPSILDPAAIKYIKDVWHFSKKSLLVVLDIQGRVVNQNALHMMWIWGSLAFPFTSSREEALWKEETWRIELLADSIDPMIFTWISERKYICLYGGEDLEWIRKFTNVTRAVATEAKINIEMLYVGKSNPKEKVRKINTQIVTENMSHVLQDLTLIWFFWVRLESMWYSKVQHGKTVENDPIMQEIMKMLSYDGSEQGWAVITRGSGEMASGKGEIILPSMTNFEQWRANAELMGFVPALNQHLLGLHTPHHCNRLILPGITGNIPEKVVCAECGRSMEKYIMYRCCTD